MREKDLEGNSWKRMVLRDRPKPAWLAEDAPEQDVILSTRARLARNLKGHQFLTTATVEETNRIMDKLVAAGSLLTPPVEIFKNITSVDRDYLVGARLISPDFAWTEPGRAVLIDHRQQLSIMVNEEDHLRAQVLTAGWNLRKAEAEVRTVVEQIGKCAPFASSPSMGFLGASIFNAKEGRRLSVMMHLIGLAHSDRIGSLISTLNANKITLRGLFGESTRAIGAYAQVSLVGGTIEQFEGVCNYLLEEERQSRKSIGQQVLKERAVRALDYVQSIPRISLAGTVRSLGWLRWAAVAQVSGFRHTVRDLDYALTSLDLRVTEAEETSAAKRAESLRKLLKL